MIWGYPHFRKPPNKPKYSSGLGLELLILGAQCRGTVLNIRVITTDIHLDLAFVECLKTIEHLLKHVKTVSPSTTPESSCNYRGCQVSLSCRQCWRESSTISNCGPNKLKPWVRTWGSLNAARARRKWRHVVQSVTVCPMLYVLRAIHWVYIWVQQESNLLTLHCDALRSFRERWMREIQCCGQPNWTFTCRVTTGQVVFGRLVDHVSISSQDFKAWIEYYHSLSSKWYVTWTITDQRSVTSQI